MTEFFIRLDTYNLDVNDYTLWVVPCVIVSLIWTYLAEWRK